MTLVSPHLTFILNGLLKSTITFTNVDATIPTEQFTLGIKANGSINLNASLNPDYYQSTSADLSGSTTLCFGLMVGNNSIGLLIKISVDYEETGSIGFDFDDLDISYDAATLNGKYYDPEQLFSALMEAAQSL